VKTGTATVTASSFNGKTATCIVMVSTNIISVTGISISETSLSLIEVETATLTASILPENATDKTVTWTSSDTSVATVSSNGEVTAIKAGSAIITATSSNGLKVTCSVTVSAKFIPVSSIVLSATEWSGHVGNTFTLSANVLPQDASEKTVVWTSEDDSVASVDGEGNVKALSLGETVITANCGGLSAECRVTVVPVLAESLTIDPTAWSGEEGSEFSITATVLPENASDKTLIWTSSDESIATVDADGNVKVLKEGNCVITVATADGSELTAECVITSVSGVEAIFSEDVLVDVYDMRGVMLNHHCALDDLKQLQSGIYIIRYGSMIKTIYISNK
ncbi:MAG: Ig-like domain-containing protein, partial [Muribaculaceae bacterium]|nr:Ig-like domain-containing protein [Muribaculaceae bacterium]